MRGAGAQTRRCAGEHHAQTGDSSNKPRLRCRSVLPSHRAYCARRCPVCRCRCQSSWTQHNQIDEHNKTRCVCHSRSTCAEGSELTESLSRSSSLDKRLRTSGGDTESLALALRQWAPATSARAQQPPTSSPVVSCDPRVGLRSRQRALVTSARGSRHRAPVTSASRRQPAACGIARLPAARSLGVTLPLLQPRLEAWNAAPDRVH